MPVGNMSLGAMASSAAFPRGTYEEPGMLYNGHKLTREALNALPSKLGVWPTSRNMQEGQTAVRELDCCEVPMKRGNARRGKAAKTLSFCWGNMYYTQG